MKSGWTPERKAKQATAIQSWKPWQKSTGPKSLSGKTKVSRNAFKGGNRSAMRRLTSALNDELKTQYEFVERVRNS